MRRNRELDSVNNVSWQSVDLFGVFPVAVIQFETWFGRAAVWRFPGEFVKVAGAEACSARPSYCLACTACSQVEQERGLRRIEDVVMTHKGRVRGSATLNETKNGMGSDWRDPMIG